jgi:hypothetical protein
MSGSGSVCIVCRVFAATEATTETKAERQLAIATLERAADGWSRFLVGRFRPCSQAPKRDSMTDTPASPQKPRSHLPWFLAWVGVGTGLAFGVSVPGVFAVPLALAAAVLLIVFHHADRSALGILVGVGSLSLYVAYVQRKGPGTVYWHTSTASGSDQYLDPRPHRHFPGVGVVAFPTSLDPDTTLSSSHEGPRTA